MTYLILQKGGDRFAFEAKVVREILWLPELGPVAHPKPGVVGLTHLRGTVVPVLDLDLCLGRPARHTYLVTDCLVIMEYQDTVAGLIVDAVLDVLELLPSEFVPTDEAGTAARGVACLDGQMVTLLDPARILASLIASPHYDPTRNGHGPSPASSTALLASGREAPSPEAQVVFRERARNIARRDAETEATAGVTTLAVVHVSGERIAIPVSRVREFSAIRNLTPVPCCPEYLRGLMNLRGELLALIDIRPVLQLPPTEAPQTAVVVQTGDLRLGIIVDAVLDVLTLPDASVRPVGTAAPSRLNGFVHGTARYDNVLLSIVDLDRILRDGGLIAPETALAPS